MVSAPPITPLTAPTAPAAMRALPHSGRSFRVVLRNIPAGAAVEHGFGGAAPGEQHLCTLHLRQGQTMLNGIALAYVFAGQAKEVQVNNDGVVVTVPKGVRVDVANGVVVRVVVIAEQQLRELHSPLGHTTIEGMGMGTVFHGHQKEAHVFGGGVVVDVIVATGVVVLVVSGVVAGRQHLPTSLVGQVEPQSRPGQIIVKGNGLRT